MSIFEILLAARSRKLYNFKDSYIFNVKLMKSTATLPAAFLSSSDVNFKKKEEHMFVGFLDGRINKYDLSKNQVIKNINQW